MRKRTKTKVIAGLLLVGGANPAAADAIDDWLTGDYATGDWGGFRTQLEDMGITPEMAYTTDLLAVRNGNAGSGDGWDYAGRVDAGINFDFEKLAGIPGLSLYASGAWSSGHDLSERQVGNMFAVAQIFTGQKVRLSQLYLRQSFDDDHYSVKVGRVTTEDDFLASDIYTYYVNGGINGTPSNVPDNNAGFTTAPFTQWGVVGTAEPIDNLRFAIGFYNGNENANDDKEHGVDFDLDPGNGMLVIGEVSYGWNQPKEEPGAEEEENKAAEAGGQPAAEPEPTARPSGLPGLAKMGVLFSSGDREDLKDGRNKKGSPGFYVSGQQMVYREPDTDDQGLTPWAVVTYLPRQSINESPVFFATGMVYKGLIPERDNDAAAIGFYYGKLSNDLEPSGSEKVLELAYTVQLTPWLYVRPDMQFVFDPSGVNSAGTAVVGGGEIGIVF
ncbi:MAG: carbohydrate porin [Rhodospirillales bacterium]